MKKTVLWTLIFGIAISLNSCGAGHVQKEEKGTMAIAGPPETDGISFVEDAELKGLRMRLREIPFKEEVRQAVPRARTERLRDARTSALLVRLDELNRHLAARREKAKTHQQLLHAVLQRPPDARFAPGGPTETAAPQPARANEHHAKIGQFLQNALHRAVPAQVLQPAAIRMAGGIENQAVTVAQCNHGTGDRGVPVSGCRC